jgi:hypothetical protein
VIFPTSLPKIKTFLRPAHLSAATIGLLVRLLTAFCQHPGRMSADAAAGAVRSQRRHRAQLARFLARSHWSRDWALLHDVAALLLQRETRTAGPWLFLLDQTYCGQQGQKTENTFHCGNRTRRPHKGRRYQKRRCAKRSGHAFVMGLLLTPSGLRIPCCRCYYTQDYCRAHGTAYRKQPQLAAELIDQLAVPAGATVVVLGDTAFEARDIRAACARRGFVWIVPLNPERVLAGAKPRAKVRSLAEGWTADDYQAVRLVPGQGVTAAQQRAASCRVGPHAKARTFWVHAERRAVHNVGEVLLVFSTTEPPRPGPVVPVQKILMTNGVGWTAADVVERYSLRWQVELFFKELKSTLGLHQYRFRRFAAVAGWVQACLVAFCYLEWYRAEQLGRSDRSEKEKGWWRWQRSHGIARRLMQEAEEADLVQLWRGSGSRSGLRRLRRILRQALPPECRKQR